MERVISSPLGPIRMKSNGEALLELEFTTAPLTADEIPDPVLDQAARELAEYFNGQRREFTIPVHQSGTPFQEKVWEELRKIPYGATISYGELARRVGQPKASRAVGGANGRNHIAIIVPCHRVISSTSRIGGYASGPEHKAFLLDLEQAPYRK